MKELTPAFILHARSYRETSLIVDFFTLKYGRLSAVARGARGQKKKVALQPFTPFVISLTGSGELKTLKNYEIYENPVCLLGDNLLIGLYVNELLVRLLGRFDPMVRLFDSYKTLVIRLSNKQGFSEQLLRCFEIDLLTDLGYGIVFDHEVSTGAAILEQKLYKYSLEGGFVPAPDVTDSNTVFQGKYLLAIGQGDFSLTSTRMAAKKIVRSALKPLLGDKPLHSRKLFIKPASGNQ
ncbi:MAG: DNA repair protein RecO [Gammaproteobacteria bacterium]|nr:DNA repair protein RecO [Gammaproteobacteria bacterium]